jgi:demethylmenaquinone methyltransferase/2-methoxy-6-polyprenyl-1,4-benzoquinol methylase
MSNQKTHFGFKQINEEIKEQKVSEVFDSVAKKYDIMNDIMSFGIHRLWKQYTFFSSNIKNGDKVLDIAGGTGDMTKGFKKLVGDTGVVWHTDINYSMLKEGQERLINCGIITPSSICNAERLPFRDNYFDVVCISFGLRNMTHKDLALQESYRVLKKGGYILILEFSKINSMLSPIYDIYSFKILPLIGQIVAKDRDSYQYLAESIRMHPNQEELKLMMEQSGFKQVSYNNLTFGICALHKGYKF